MSFTPFALALMDQKGWQSTASLQLQFHPTKHHHHLDLFRTSIHRWPLPSRAFVQLFVSLVFICSFGCLIIYDISSAAFLAWLHSQQILLMVFVWLHFCFFDLFLFSFIIPLFTAAYVVWHPSLQLIAQLDDLCYWYLDFYFDHLYFKSQITKKYSIVLYYLPCRSCWLPISFSSSFFFVHLFVLIISQQHTSFDPLPCGCCWLPADEDLPGKASSRSRRAQKTLKNGRPLLFPHSLTWNGCFVIARNKHNHFFSFTNIRINFAGFKAKICNIYLMRSNKVFMLTLESQTDISEK